VFAGQDRDSLRAVFFRAWGRHTRGEPLEGVETLIVRVAGRHPEYHALLESSDSNGRDYPPEAVNPFLHMAMHIAIEESLVLDEPSGIREHYRALLQRHGDEHAVQHRMMDCLADMLWRAQREARAPDSKAYLECLARQAMRPSP
jgi:hypothetical protein